MMLMEPASKVPPLIESWVSSAERDLCPAPQAVPVVLDFSIWVATQVKLALSFKDNVMAPE